ncbi:MAG TPA: hypothetical protein VMY34_06350 [Acidimicrobiales bacterium]|nr:hypothetical protein [Acidimicrobiales bacterium]
MSKLGRMGVATLLLALAACGSKGEIDGASARATSTSSSTTSSTSLKPASFVVKATIKAAYPKPMRHIVRVERPDGKQVFERSLDASLTTSEDLMPGDYRVLSYQRECNVDTCGPTSPDTDFGQPVDLCGSYFSVTAAKPTIASVEITPDDGCTVTLG